MNYDVKMVKSLKKNKKIHCIENVTETFYSEQGIYQVTSRDIFKLNVSKEGRQQICENGMNWILDESVWSREKVYQMPVEHMKMTLKNLIFSQSPESNLRFVISFHENEKNIVDFYFEVDVFSQNDIPWKEINDFIKNPLSFK